MTRILTARTIIFTLALMAYTCLAPHTGHLQDRILFNSGPELVAFIHSLQPEQEMDQLGSLNIFSSSKKPQTVPLRYKIVLTPTNWISTYIAWPECTTNFMVKVIFSREEPPVYIIEYSTNDLKIVTPITNKAELWTRFCNSDFYIADLGLEFLYWANQRLIKREMRRSRYCYVLESTPPPSAFSPYARVISWIDTETFGIVRAEARDTNNKLIKEFEPKEFKKIQGVWYVTELQIRDFLRSSRTRIQFTLQNTH